MVLLWNSYLLDIFGIELNSVLLRMDLKYFLWVIEWNGLFEFQVDLFQQYFEIYNGNWNIAIPVRETIF
jgi:hypothetical protein